MWRVVNAVRSMPRNGASFPFIRTGGMKGIINVREQWQGTSPWWAVSSHMQR